MATNNFLKNAFKRAQQSDSATGAAYLGTSIKNYEAKDNGFTPRQVSQPTTPVNTLASSRTDKDTDFGFGATFAAQAGIRDYSVKDEFTGITTNYEGKLSRDKRKYGNKVYDDTFFGQSRANYALGRLTQDQAAAWSAYLYDPTPENRKAAEELDALVEKFTGNNTAALDDENVKAEALSKSFAGYLPQFVDQAKAQAVGLMGGLAVGAPKVGASVASGVQSYNTMRGSAFKRLMDLGVDEATARTLASDEAFINGLIEAGDTYLEWAMFGGKKLFPKAAGKVSAAANSTALAKAAKAMSANMDKLPKGVRSIASYLLNLPQEYGEESAQEIVALTTDQKALSGDVDGTFLQRVGGLARDSVKTGFDIFTGNDFVVGQDENGNDIMASQQVKEAGMEGLRIAAISGGIKTAGGMVLNRVTSPGKNAEQVAARPKQAPDQDKPVTTTSPAAAPEVQQLTQQAEAVQAANPEATVLDAATTMYFDIAENKGKNTMKKAKLKAEVVNRLIEGKKVEDGEINALNLTDQNYREVFTKLTGVQFPAGKLQIEQLRSLARSAHTVAQQAKQVQAAPAAPVAPITQTRVAERVAQAQQHVAQAVPETDNAITFEAFVEHAKQYPEYANAGAEVLEVAYAQFLQDSGMSVEMNGKPMSFAEFVGVLRSAPDGDKLTVGEAGIMFQQMAQRQNMTKEANYGGQDLLHSEGLSGQPDQRSRGQSRSVPETAGRAEGDGGTRRGDQAGSRAGRSGEVRSAGQNQEGTGSYRTVKVNDNPMTEVRPEAYTPEMQGLVDQYAAIGVNAHIVIEGYPIDAEGHYADGVTIFNTDGTTDVFLQVVGAHAMAERSDHEKAHVVLGRDPAAKEQAIAALGKAMSENELLDLVNAYLPMYGSAYANSEDLVGDLLEEIVCDAYANLNRANAGAPKYHDAVSGVIEAQLQTYSASYGQDVTLTDDAGNLVVESDGNGRSTFSMSTYQDSGRDILTQWMGKAVVNGDLTQQDADDIVNTLDLIYDICEEARGDYAPFDAWSEAKVVVNEQGNPVFSVVKANGDYAMNLDFSLVCKKRRTLDAVLNELVKQGFVDNLALNEKQIVKINDLIRSYGFEVACDLCFVDAKRYRQGKVADDFVKLYNGLVQSMIPKGSGLKPAYFNFGQSTVVDNAGLGIHELPDDQLDFTKIEKVLKEKGEKSVEYKTAMLLKTSPADRKLTMRGDFLSTRGFDELNLKNPRVLKLFNSKKGSGGPKSAVSDVQYLNEVLTSKTFTPEKAYAVGGVRIQSFSDYVPRMVFDYVQMIADLAAKKLPAHAYTKEELFVKQFGLTGMKINMSLIPKVVDGGIAPGLDADGNYAWADESFNFDEAKKIQKAEGYSRNCGTIAVGVSDEHIRKLMADPEIRMVIPYHKSGLNPVVAKMNKIEAFVNYTDFQNTRRPNGKNGKKLDKDVAADKKLLSEMPDFNTKMRELGDPRAAAEFYVRWCEDNNLLPKFDQFAYKTIDGMPVERDGKRVVDENYYKLLEDFTVYDKGKYVEQTGLTMTFPAEDSAFGDMKGLIKRGLSEDALLEAKRDADVPKIVNDIKQMKFSAAGWKPNLDSAEWDIVKSVMNNGRGTNITSIDKMFFESTKGKSVFGIYSTDDDTLLYASRGEDAVREHQFVEFVKEEFENGGLADTSTKGIRALAERARMQSVGNSGDNVTVGGSDRLGRYAGLDGRQPRFHASAALENVLTNILKAEESRRANSVTAQASEESGAFISPEEVVSPEALQARYSIVDDTALIKRLEEDDYITVYKAMVQIDGELYPPMSSQEKVTEEYTDKKGNVKTRTVRKLKNPSILGRWQKSDERPDLVKEFQKPTKKYPDGYGKFELLKSDNSSPMSVAYNPYEHTSNIVLNDQFATAYKRPELVTVEFHIPKSEATGLWDANMQQTGKPYKARYAKDPVGLTDWKAGGVAQKLKNSHRDVYLTRWSKPVRVLSDAEVAQKYKEILDKEKGIMVPWNVVTPSLRHELEALGVTIDYSDAQAGENTVAFADYFPEDYAKLPKPTQRKAALESERKAKQRAEKAEKKAETASPKVKYSAIDADYMAAVERGDMDTAQKMVDEAAKEAGFPVKLYHGTTQFGFTKPDAKRGDDGISFFASDSLEVAETYSSKDSVRQVSDKVISDEDFEGLEKAYDDHVYTFIDTVNRTAGVYNFFPYSDHRFDDLRRAIVEGAQSYEDVADDLNDLVEDIVSALYENAAYYDTELEPDAFYESDEIQKVYAASGELYHILKGLELALDGSAGNYQLYANTDNLFEIDAKGKRWNNIPFDEYDTNGFHPVVNTRQAAAYAKANGFEGVKISNLFDDGGRSVNPQLKPATVYIFFKPEIQTKSADPVTYDDNGNVIPLSERFKTTNPDIRYSVTPAFEKWYKETYGEDLTSSQLKRRLQTAERRAEQAEHDRKAAELKNTIDSQMNLTAWMMHHTKKMREQKRTMNEKLAEARKEKTAAVRAAVAETKEIERAKAEVQHDADRMAERRAAAKRLRTREDAYKQKVTKMKENHKLKRNAAKATLRDKRLLDKKRAEIEAEQGLVNTIRQNPKQRSGVEKLQNAGEALRTLGRTAYRNFVNMAEAIDRFSKRQAEGMRAGTLVNILGGCTSTVERCFKEGLVDRSGNRIGDSMSDVFLCWDEAHKTVSEERQALLQDFMLHRHNIDRMSIVARAESALETFENTHEWLRDMDTKEFARLVAMTEKEVEKTGKYEAQQQAFEYARLLRAYNEAQNKPIFADDKGNPVTAETSQKRVDKYLAEQPWLLEKANGIYEWWDLFMRNWAVGDTVSEAEYARMRQMYPHYVPTYRTSHEGVGGAGFVGNGAASVSKAVKKAKGSTEEVMNIEDSFSKMVGKIVRLNRLNEMYMNIVDTAMLDDDGVFADMAAFDWDSSWQSGEYANALREDAWLNGNLEDAVDDAETLGLEKVGNDYKLTGWKDGRKYTAFISEDLYKSIGMVTGHLANDLEEGLLKIGNTLTGPMKTFITGINPTFAVRNLSRDLPTAIINSISGLAFPKYYAQAAKEIAQNSEQWQQFQALGGTNATYYNDNKGFVKDMTGKHPVKKVRDTLGSFNEVTEAQTRFAEYLATIDKLGDTYENRLQGIKNSAEVTVDFSRKGRYGKVINAWVPYWNPAVQGIDKTVRSLIESPDGSAIWKQASKTLGRAAMTTILFEAVLQAVLHGLDRDDEWEELNDRTKDTYYCIPLKDSKTFLKIPKNREWGAILGTPFMRMLEYANGRENPFENYIETAIEPNFLPPAIFRPDAGGGFASDIIGVSQALDLAKNEDFAGRTIVPYSYQQGTLSQQYDSETSWFAKQLGSLLNWSPMQIDYILGDYFGDIGEMILQASSDATLTGEQDLGKAALDIVTSPFVADARYSNYAVSKYYDTLNDLDRVVQDRKNQLGTDEAKKTIEYQTQKALNELYGKAITELNREVREMPDGEEKDALKSQIAELANEALEFYNDSISGKIENPELTATYVNQSKSVADELIRMDGQTGEYNFKPRTSAPKSYADPDNKGREYILTEEQQEYFMELYREEYNRVFEHLIKSSKYKNAKDTRKAEMLEDAKQDVQDAAKEQLFSWLKRNGVRSTPKK